MGIGTMGDITIEGVSDKDLSAFQKYLESIKPKPKPTPQEEPENRLIALWLIEKDGTLKLTKEPPGGDYMSALIFTSLKSTEGTYIKGVIFTSKETIPLLDNKTLT